jgi:hypothetical protein
VNTSFVSTRISASPMERVYSRIEQSECEAKLTSASCSKSETSTSGFATRRVSASTLQNLSARARAHAHALGSMIKPFFHLHLCVRFEFKSFSFALNLKTLRSAAALRSMKANNAKLTQSPLCSCASPLRKFRNFVAKRCGTGRTSTRVGNTLWSRIACSK